MRVAAVDDDVAGVQMRLEVGDGRVDDRGRDHQPDRARLRERGHERANRVGPGRAFSSQRLHRVRGTIEDDALVAAAHEPPHHVAAHAPETDHAELHVC